jgi:hypothetical protein
MKRTQAAGPVGTEHAPEASKGRRHGFAGAARDTRVTVMRKLVSLLGIGLLAAACTGAGASGSTPAPTYNVATGSDQLVLRITTGGGLVPVEYTLTHTPWFSLYGDGLVVVQGPANESYPGPLLPNLRQMRVTPAEIQKILAAADGAGLLGPDARFDATDIYDASTTTFTTIVDGKTHTIGAYALDFEGGTVDAAAARIREKLSGFEGELGNLAAFLDRQISDAETYDAAAMRLFTSPVDSSEQNGQTRPVLAWPLSVDPGTAGEATKVTMTRCLVVTGSDLEAFLAAAKTANSLTLWTYGANRYSVLVRPLYPDETGCPAT